jgi:adenosylhomocysteine nucleosidase
MRQEVKPFLKALGVFTRIPGRGLPTFSFRLAGRDCLLVECGIGVRKAEEATRALMERHHPGILVSFGVAGAVTAEARVGDVVLVQSVCRLDHGAVVDCRPTAPWSAAAMERAESALAARMTDSTVYHGTLVRGGTAVTTSGENEPLAGAHDIACAVVEMETAGVQRAAAERGVPLLSIRSISDSPDEPLPFSIAESMDRDGRLRPGRILAMALHDPRLILRLVRLGKNMNRAMGNLAAVVIAAVEGQISDPT